MEESLKLEQYYRHQNLELENKMKFVTENLQNVSNKFSGKNKESGEKSTSYLLKVDRNLEKFKSNISNLLGTLVNQGIPYF